MKIEIVPPVPKVEGATIELSFKELQLINLLAYNHFNLFDPMVKILEKQGTEGPIVKTVNELMDLLDDLNTKIDTIMDQRGTPLGLPNDLEWSE